MLADDAFGSSPSFSGPSNENPNNEVNGTINNEYRNHDGYNNECKVMRQDIYVQ